VIIGRRTPGKAVPPLVAGTAGGVFMGIAISLAVACLVCAPFCNVQARMNRYYGLGGTSERMDQAGGSKLIWPKAGCGLLWITPSDLLQAMGSDAELFIFQLIDDEHSFDWNQWERGTVLVTLPQLEEAIPWVSQRNKIVIYRPFGIDSNISQRLSALARKREVFVVAQNIAAAPRRFDRMAGATCN
jgi:hypothetical protein